MTFTRRDGVATGLVALAVLTFVATHAAWGVPLIGDGHRWATALILALGVGAYVAARVTSRSVVALAAIAGVLGLLALATGSLTPLSLLVIDIVAMWVLTTLRPAQPLSHRLSTGDHHA